MSAVSSARDYPEGVDTLTGNFTHQSTDLSMPVQGNTLHFSRNYASAGISRYTSSGLIRSSIPGGWVHNYEMQLATHSAQFVDAVEVQTPGGAILPFSIDSTGGISTFTPFPGVTADLIYTSTTNEYILTGFEQTAYHFNQAGRLTEQRDAFGNAIAFAYDATTGRLITATQASRYLAYGYDAQGRLSSVTDNSGRIVQLHYDAVDHLDAVTDTLGLATTYAYSGTTQLLTTITDPSGRTVKDVAYDATGRAHEVSDGNGNTLLTIDFALSATDGITENTVFQRGITMTHQYDARRTLVGVTYECSGESGCQTGFTQAFDSNFKINQITDANGNQTEMDWNDLGCNLEHVTDALTQTTALQYDALNNLTTVTNARSHTTQFGYQNASLPTFQTMITNALDYTTTYRPYTSGSWTGLLQETEDANGNLIRYEYNSFGQIVGTIQAYGTSDALFSTYEYDSVGRLIVVRQTGSIGETQDETSRAVLYIYDAGDRQVATIENWTGQNPSSWRDQCTIPAPDPNTNICSRYGYDAAGRLISTTNALGQTNLTFYDDAGRVYLTIDTYDGSPGLQEPVGEICDWTNPDPEYNVCTLVGYDTYGRVISTTNGLGHVNRTFYDPLGRVAGTIVNQTSVSSLQSCAFPPQNADQDLCTLYAYDAVGNTVIVTDTLGRMTRTFYDELNRVAGTIDNWSGSIDSRAALPDCFALPAERDSDICTLYAYDEVGNTILITDTLGRMTRTFYDELNRVEATVSNWQPTLTAPAGCDVSPTNAADENICTLYGYDSAGRQITVTNALSQTSLTVYDAANRPVVQVRNWNGNTIDTDGNGCMPTAESTANFCTLTGYDELGQMAAVTDTLGNVTTFGYDGLGRLVTTTRTLDGAPIVQVTTYDALGNRLTATDAEDQTTTFIYDSRNRLVSTISQEGIAITQTYNAAGWVLTTTNALGVVAANSYDDLGRLLSTTDAEGNTTHYAYDAAGNQVSMTDAAGIVTRYVYDDLNRLVQVIENEDDAQPVLLPANVTTEYVYDALGNRLVITNALAYTRSLTTYDDLNRPTVVEDALGNQTQTTYNALGYRTVMTDGNGEVTTYQYDTLNRLAQISYLADSETVSYDYDAIGNRIEMTDGTGRTAYQYDTLYRLITVTNSFSGVVGYGYDLVGNRTRLTYPDDSVVTYDYDGDNRLIEVYDWNNGTTTYDYDNVGRLVTTTLPNEIRTVYGYDQANRLVELTHYDDHAELIAHFAYELDQVGNRITVTELLLQPLPSGWGVARAEDVPGTADDIVAAIQPPDLHTDRQRSRTARLLPTLGLPPAPGLTGRRVRDAEPAPIDPGDVAERARNTIHATPQGRGVITSTRHSAWFELAGDVRFLPVADPILITSTAGVTAPVPMTVTVDPAVPLTLTVELDEITVGASVIPLLPAAAHPLTLTENVAIRQRAPGVTETFIARDVGIEQRWVFGRLPDAPGDLVIAIEATTALSVSIDRAGFTFHAPIAGGGQTVPVATYGRALAVDAAGDTQWADLAVVDLGTGLGGLRRYRLEMRFPAAWMAQAQLPLLVDPLMSSAFLVEDEGLNSDQHSPQVAYNPDDDEYLVVWQDYRSGSNWHIYGQLVSAEGELIGENFAIVTGSYDRMVPRVAYGGEVYLVTWRHYVTSSSYQARAQRLKGDGSLAGSQLTISTQTAATVEDIAYDSTAENFLAVYKANAPIRIYGRHVELDGSMGTQFQISASSSSYQDTASVTYNPDDDEYLVVWRWRTYDHLQRDILGLIFPGDTTQITTSNTIDVADGSGYQERPDVAYSSELGRYVVVWDNNLSGSQDVHGRFMHTDGSFDGPIFVAANESVNEWGVRVTHDGHGGMLLTWQADNGGTASKDIYGRLLTANGPAADTFVIKEADGQQQTARIASNGNQMFLLAWMDDASGNWNTYAALYHAPQMTVIAYDYDALYRLTSASYVGAITASYDYVYDDVGNMTAYTETIGAETVTVARTFDAANQLATSDDGNTVEGSSTTTYTYDDNGNLVTINPPGASTLTQYAYDQRNLLRHVSDTASELPVVMYVYDGNGDRVQLVDYTGAQAVTTTFTLDVLGMTQVLLADDGTTETAYLFGLDLIAQDDGADVRTMLADGLGSVRMEIQDGAVETASTYEPYGKLLVQSGTSGTVYGYTGEQEDGATGLVYLRARYYNPYLNQFQSRDPFPGYATLPQSLNRHNYVHSNPTNLVDSSGLCPEIGDEACWSIYEALIRKYPWALSYPDLPQLYGFYGKKLHELPARTLQSMLENGIGKPSKWEYAYSPTYGWFDNKHISPNFVLNQVLGPIRSLVNEGRDGVVLVRRDWRYPVARLDSQYWVSGSEANQDNIVGIAFAIYMDFEKRWEEWQGRIGPGHSRFAIEDLPSDYVGFYAAVTGRDVVDILTRDLGVTRWDPHGPPPPQLSVEYYAGVSPLGASEGAFIPVTEAKYIEPNANYQWTPKILNDCGEYVNIPWPNHMRIDPIYDSNLWHHISATSTGILGSRVSAP